MFTQLLGVALGMTIAQGQAPPDVFRVALTRNDNHVASIGTGVTFDKDAVAQAMAKTPVTLPDVLPPGAVVGFNSADGGFVIAVPADDGASALLTVDANANRDLRDDAAVRVGRAVKRGDGTIIRIKRTYPEPPSAEAWLPYRFVYSPRPAKQGGAEQPGFFVTAAYRMDGSFTHQGAEYVAELSDFNLRGRFDRSNLSRGTVLRVYRKGAPEDERPQLWGYELIPLGDEFYEVAAGAVDGSWLELKRNTLPHTAIGRPAPDFKLTDTEGATFSLNEYRGRYLLLDFWPSWCGPCIAQFPTIKKTVDQYAGRLAVVGINLDNQDALATARKIVAEKTLTWRHVMEGRGYFLPIYQIFGRLPEHRMSFPLYVAIAPDGLIGYATNDFAKMQMFFDAKLGATDSRVDALFVPLASARQRVGSPLPVDFGSPALTALLKRPNVKMPADLPQSTRVGRLPNDTLLIARSDGDRMVIRVDADRDFDLANDQDTPLPLLDGSPEKGEAGASVPVTVTYAGGARSMRPFRFFAQRPKAGESRPADILYVGWHGTASGSFVSGNVEYEIVMADPTNDLVWSTDDWKAEGAFVLREKRDGKWVTAHSGSTGIPIGGRVFRVAHVHDDGQMVKLEAVAPAGAR